VLRSDRFAEWDMRGRTSLEFPKRSPDVASLAALRLARKRVRDMVVTDHLGTRWRIVDAAIEFLVSGSREAADLQQIEFDGLIERVR
jgi:hypothetical protein